MQMEMIIISLCLFTNLSVEIKQIGALLINTTVNNYVHYKNAIMHLTKL